MQSTWPRVDGGAEALPPSSPMALAGQSPGSAVPQRGAVRNAAASVCVCTPCVSQRR